MKKLSINSFKFNQKMDDYYSPYIHPPDNNPLYGFKTFV